VNSSQNHLRKRVACYSYNGPGTSLTVFKPPAYAGGSDYCLLIADFCLLAVAYSRA
jgi:hypothetical protein